MTREAHITPETPFLNTCRTDDLGTVIDYIKNGFNIHTTDANGDYPIHHACAAGALSIVKYLCAEGTKVDEPNNKGNRPVHTAAHFGHLPVIQFLCEEQKVELEHKNEGGLTPFLRACYYGHLPIVQYLHSRKANVRECDKKGNTALSLVCGGSSIELLKYLCELKVVYRNAVNQGPALTMPMLDMNARNKDGQTPLMIACEKGDLIALKYFCEQRGIQPSEEDICSGLKSALKNKHFIVVDYFWDTINDEQKSEILSFLETQLSVEENYWNTLSSYQKTYATRLCWKQHTLSVTNHLWPTFTEKDRSYFFVGACVYANVELVKYLCEQKGVDLNKNDIPINASIQIVKQKKPDIIAYLWSQGNDWVRSSLMLAMFLEKQLSLFDDYWIKLDEKQKYYIIAMAIKNNSLPFTEYLWLKMNTESEKAIFFSIICATSNPEWVSLWIKKYNVNALNRFGITALASATGNLEVLKYLCEKEYADLFAKGDKGENALHRACFAGHFEAVKYLCIRMGTEMNQRTSKGLHAGHIACYRGHLEIVKYLVEFNPSMKLESAVGNQPSLFEYTCQLDHRPIVLYLWEKQYNQLSPDYLNSFLSGALRCHENIKPLIHLFLVFTYLRQNEPAKMLMHLNAVFESDSSVLDKGLEHVFSETGVSAYQFTEAEKNKLLLCILNLKTTDALCEKLWVNMMHLFMTASNQNSATKEEALYHAVLFLDVLTVKAPQNKVYQEYLSIVLGLLLGIQKDIGSAMLTHIVTTESEQLRELVQRINDYFINKQLITSPTILSTLTQHCADQQVLKLWQEKQALTETCKRLMVENERLIEENTRLKKSHTEENDEQGEINFNFDLEEARESHENLKTKGNKKRGTEELDHQERSPSMDKSVKFTFLGRTEAANTLNFEEAQQEKYQL